MAKTILTIFTLLIMYGVVHAEMKERDVKKLVEEYVSAGTDAGRRGKITETLKAVDPILAQKSLKKAIKDGEERPHALELAVALRVPGLFSTAEKYIDGDDEQQIVKLGLVTRDKDAGKTLAKRWKEKPTDSASFKYVHDGLLAHPIGLDGIGELKDALKGERADLAGAVLRFQLGADTDEPDALLSQWDGLEAAYKLDAKEFTFKGVSATALPTFKVSGARRVGGNYRMPKGAEFTVDIPEEFNEGDFTLTVYLRANYEGPDKGAKFTIWHERTHFDFVHRKGEWFIPSRAGAEYAGAAGEGEWATLEFSFKDKSTDSMKYVREFSFEVNGKVVVPKGSADGRMARIQFEARNSVCTFGGAAFSR